MDESFLDEGVAEILSVEQDCVDELEVDEGLFYWGVAGEVDERLD